MAQWRPRFSWFGIITLIFLLMPLLAACGSSSPTVAGPSVSMTDNEFTPATLHIKAGQTVTWVNNGQTGHVFRIRATSRFARREMQAGHHR